MTRFALFCVVVMLAGCRTTRTVSRETAFDDLIVLTSGERLQGRVLTENTTEVSIAQRWGTFTFARDQVQSVSRKAVAADVIERSDSHRLPPFSAVIQALNARWSTTVQQVPATVIDVGVLRHVPYLSHRAGNVELNVYGDPEAPSGIEVGLKGPTDADKQELRAFIAGLLPQPKDQQTAAGLALDAAQVEAEGLSFEVTPDNAPDAFGAWWISVYDVPALDAARASADEQQQIVAEQTSAQSGWSGYHPTYRPWRRAPAPRVYVRSYSYSRPRRIYVPGPPLPRLVPRPPRFP
ncbi:MAG: hypothetical protein JNK82_20810 [Myxococcaceae bacterium]|nr:hypothetical protein [Myxococcaceae bacterium]